MVTQALPQVGSIAREKRADRQAMLEAQSGRCALCQDALNSLDSATLDLDRMTQAVRGLLCRACAIFLRKNEAHPGQMRARALRLEALSEQEAVRPFSRLRPAHGAPDPTRLRRAADYVEYPPFGWMRVHRRSRRRAADAE